MTACGNNAGKGEGEAPTEDTPAENTPAEEEETDKEGYKIGFSLMTISDAVMAQTIQDAEAYIKGKGGELLVSDAGNRCNLHVPGGKEGYGSGNQSSCLRNWS